MAHVVSQAEGKMDELGPHRDLHRFPHWININAWIQPVHSVSPPPTQPARRGRPPRDAETKGVRKGARLQISLTIAPELLSRIDGLADTMGQTRAAVINLAIYRLLSQEATDRSGPNAG